MFAFNIIYNLLHVCFLLFLSYLLVITAIITINDATKPFVSGNRPPDKYFGIIKYEQIRCMFCGKYIDDYYKRCVFGFGIVGWNGGAHCEECVNKIS